LKDLRMTPTETLRHEHQVILLVLNGAVAQAARAGQTGKFDKDKIEKMVEFCRNFVDRCHHGKEEKHLFPRMCSRIPLANAPVSVMLREHEEGRRLVAALSKAIEQQGPQAAREIRDILLSYDELVRNHIAKEDNILYPIADKGLDAHDHQILSEAFNKLEAEELGIGVHEKYHQMAHELAE